MYVLLVCLILSDDPTRDLDWHLWQKHIIFLQYAFSSCSVVVQRAALSASSETCSNRSFLLQFSTSALKMSGTAKLLHSNLWETDPELMGMVKNEKRRQERGLEMIASENFTSLSVLQCLSSCLHNKYSEGLPGQR